MTIRQLLPILCLVLLLSGCIPNEFRVENGTEENSSTAEQVIKDESRVKGAAVLFHEDHLLVGIRVKTFSRFNKRKIASAIEKELQKKYPELSVFVSADSKILTETTKLILNKEQIDVLEEIHELIALAEEQT